MGSTLSTELTNKRIQILLDIQEADDAILRLQEGSLFAGERYKQDTLDLLNERRKVLQRQLVNLPTN